MTDATHTELADRVRTAVLGVDGVLDLHGGALGEVATYLPGRRVAGVRLTTDRATVQIAIAYDRPMQAVADRVRAAVRPLVGTPVDVVVADVHEPASSTQPGAGTPAASSSPVTQTPSTPAPTRSTPAKPAPSTPAPTRSTPTKPAPKPTPVPTAPVPTVPTTPPGDPS